MIKALSAVRTDWNIATLLHLAHSSLNKQINNEYIKGL